MPYGSRARHWRVAGSLAGILVALIGAGILFGLALKGPWRDAAAVIDRAGALWVHGTRSAAMDVLMPGLSWVGERWPMIVATSSLYFYMRWRRRAFSALNVLVCLPGTAIIWQLVSLVVWRERPNYWVVHHPLDRGYPGGHVMNAVVIAGVCLTMFWPRARTRERAAALGFWLAFIGGTFLCRIYINAHFLTDQIAGSLLGLAWVLAALQVCRRAFPDVRDADGSPTPGSASGPAPPSPSGASLRGR